MHYKPRRNDSIGQEVRRICFVRAEITQVSVISLNVLGD